jgi:hypothetical protein
VIIQERVTNLELGMKALMRELDALDAQAEALK